MAFASAWTSVGVGWGTGNATAGNRELALNIVTIVDPTETPTLAVMAKTTTNSLYHDYSIDALAATSIAPAGEGDDFSTTTYGDATKRTARIQNYVMRFRKDIEVTNDQLEMSRRGQTIGIDDLMRYEAGKGTKEVTRNGNVKLWNLGSATGSATAAGASTGTNHDAGATGQYSEFRNLHWFARTGAGQLGAINASGIAASAMATNQSGAFGTAAFYGLQAAMWSAGAKPNTLFCSGPVKTQVSRTLLNDSVATAGGLSLARNNDSVMGGEYGPVIDVVRTDYGRVAVIMDRWIPTSGATSTSFFGNGAYYLAEREKLRQAWWRPITPYPLPPAGDSARMYVQGAFTVEVLHPKCLGIAYNVSS